MLAKFADEPVSKLRGQFRPKYLCIEICTKSPDEFDIELSTRAVLNFFVYEERSCKPKTAGNNITTCHNIDLKLYFFHFQQSRCCTWIQKICQVRSAPTPVSAKTINTKNLAIYNIFSKPGRVVDVEQISKTGISTDRISRNNIPSLLGPVPAEHFQFNARNLLSAPTLL